MLTLVSEGPTVLFVARECCSLPWAVLQNIRLLCKTLDDLSWRWSMWLTESLGLAPLPDSTNLRELNEATSSACTQNSKAYQLAMGKHESLHDAFDTHRFLSFLCCLSVTQFGPASSTFKRRIPRRRWGRCGACDWKCAA